MAGHEWFAGIAAALLGIVPICDGQSTPGSISRVGTVQIEVKDGYGAEIKRSEVRLMITSQSGADFSPNDFTGTVRLPFGQYVFRITVPGFSIWRREVQVHQSQTRITAAMPLGALEGPRPLCDLSGQIFGGGTRQMWVRLLPLFTDEIVEADISQDGRFMLNGVECGDYILAIISAGKVLRSQYVRLKHEPNNISVQLGAER